jgi:phage anti-repressor protein
MNQLIKITEVNGKKAVSAIELYNQLGFDITNWAKWHRKNITGNQFAIENEDYVVLVLSTRTVDYALSLDFAKKLSMLARTEQGEKVRNYFIEVEKVALQSNSDVQLIMQQAQMLLQSLQITAGNTKAIEMHEERLKSIESKQDIEIKQDYFTILAYCKRNNIQLSFSEAIQKGKIATRLSKEKGIDLRQVSDEKYGYVNSYKDSILKETFQL